ncbi:hypothetical protein CHOTACABRAS_213 [Bacillus phage Chotacabras]|nr:hypothetical protein CHOTACABRAS_213 [Bacillus phage Chotacabras]
MSTPPFTYDKEVTQTVTVFDKKLFKVGTPVAMHTYTAGVVNMYWETEYGLVKKNAGETLTITTMKTVHGVGEEFETTISTGYLDAEFHIVPLDNLIKQLQGGTE